MESSRNLSDWDLDFRRGQIGENLLADIVETSEVKTDYQWQNTGNLYVEYECWYVNDNKWKPSGIEVSKAKYWTFVIPVADKQQVALSVPISLVKKLCKTAPKVPMHNSENPSKGYLIKVSQIWNALSEEASKGRKTA